MTAPDPVGFGDKPGPEGQSGPAGLAEANPEDSTAAEASRAVGVSVDAAGFDLGELVRTHQAAVWRYLRHLGAEAVEADDLTQDTFLAVARSTFVERSSAETVGYLRTAARRQLLMLRRKQSRRINTVELDAADAAWAEAFPTASPGDLWDARVDAAKRCVEQLAGRAREAIDLMYRQTTGREAIAERLGMTADGVKTLLRRTRGKLRECIEGAVAADG